MRNFVVPCLLLVEAENPERAEKIAGDVQELVNIGGEAEGVRLLLDEKLDTFAYDPDRHEIHSALDREEVERS